jgi:hypothetical protein
MRKVLASLALIGCLAGPAASQGPAPVDTLAVVHSWLDSPGGREFRAAVDDSVMTLRLARASADARADSLRYQLDLALLKLSWAEQDKPTWLERISPVLAALGAVALTLLTVRVTISG